MNETHQKHCHLPPRYQFSLCRSCYDPSHLQQTSNVPKNHQPVNTWGGQRRINPKRSHQRWATKLPKHQKASTILKYPLRTTKSCLLLMWMTRQSNLMKHTITISHLGPKRSWMILWVLNRERLQNLSKEWVDIHGRSRCRKDLQSTTILPSNHPWQAKEPRRWLWGLP
jgi:hypothetical protein